MTDTPLTADELENTVWIDEDGYPTQAALEAVATLPSPQVFEVMRRSWWMPTRGVRNELSAAEAELVDELEGTPWRFATGGWSGNEDLIGALQESWTWRWTWCLTAAGGLYIFDVPAEELPGGRVREHQNAREDFIQENAVAIVHERDALIERHRTRITKLEAQAGGHRLHIQQQLATIAALTERAEKAEAALRSIAANTCCAGCGEAALVARAALEGKR